MKININFIVAISKYKDSEMHSCMHSYIDKQAKRGGGYVGKKRKKRKKEKVSK